jgi:hypothetical protein
MKLSTEKNLPGELYPAIRTGMLPVMAVIILSLAAYKDRSPSLLRRPHRTWLQAMPRQPSRWRPTLML